MRCLVTLLLFLLANAAHAQTFQINDKVDVYSTDGNYYAATVIEVDGSKYKIHYDAFPSANDTWVLGSSLVRGGRRGDKIVVVTTSQTFYGTIEEVQNTKYKVKYDGYADNYELVRSQFSFVSPAGQAASLPQPTAPATTATQSLSSVANTMESFSVGNQVQALQGSRWYGAVIKDTKNGKFLVKYDGYNEEEWVAVERLRVKSMLPVDKTKLTTGKTYLRSIRWIATGATELNWYFLGDNGVIVVDPVHGTNPINFVREQSENYKNVGYYTIAGNEIRIKWLSGNTTTLGLKYSNGEISEMDAGGIMVRQKGLPESYRLSGTYSGTIGYGGVASAGIYNFTKDGQITRTQTGFSRTADGGSTTNGTKSGTYIVKGNTITMSYTDGTKETANIGVFPGVNDKVVLNGVWLSAR